MKRKGLLRTGMFLLSLFLLLELTSVAYAQSDTMVTKVTVLEKPLQKSTNERLIVDQSGTGDYTSIQDAIDHASPSSTVYVKTGTYDEIIQISKKITLIGEEKEQTIISPCSAENGYAIRITAAGVTLSTLSICNKATGLYTMGVHVSALQTTIEHCNIFDTPVGIGIWSSDNVVSNCCFWGCTDEGIALLGSPFSKCENNEVANCEFYENCDGLELQYSSNNVISHCSFYANTHTGIDAIASSNNNNIISDCKIYENEVHGIYLSRSSYNQIRNCAVVDNKDGNIVTTVGSQDNEIETDDPEKSTISYDRSNLRHFLCLFFSFLQLRLTV